MWMKIKKWFHQFAFSTENQTYYSVNKDGRLVLDKRGLIKSGKMERQFRAARELSQKQ